MLGSTRFMQYSRRNFKQHTDHGKGDGSGFSEVGPIGLMKLRYECEKLFNWFGGAATAQSVGTRTDCALTKRRDGKACNFDALIPANFSPRAARRLASCRS